MPSPAQSPHPDAPPLMQGAEHAVPLTEAQEGLWYAQRLDPHNSIFNTGHCTEISGAFEAERFAAAVNQTLREANSLSLAFIDDQAGPRQYLDVGRIPVLERIDLSGSPSADADAERLMMADLHTAIDPVQTPLARHVLFSIAPDRHLWYQRVHHLAADGYGMALIELRAVQLYQALGDGSPAGAPLTPFQEVVRDDAAYRQGEKRVKDAAYWHAYLADLDDVASLSSASAMTASSFLQARREMDEPFVALLRQRQEGTGCSWPDVLTCLISAYVQRHTAQPSVVMGVPWMGRMGNVSARSVATIMNVIPLRLEIDEREPLDALIQTCSRQLMKSRRHGRYRGEQLRRDLGLLDGLRRLHSPLINILPFDAAYERSRLQARQRVLCAGPVEDLNFNVRAAQDGGMLRLEIEANPKLYRQQDLDAHLVRLADFLQRALLADTLGEVQTLGPHEYRHWVHEVNQTQHEVPETTLDALVAATCARHPEQPALIFGQQQLSYAAFDTQVARVAAHLRSAGVHRGDIVAVALPRSDRMVVCLHAILRAGAAYLPLDIEQPSGRIERILSSARPAAAIGDAGTLALLARLQTPRLDVDVLFDTPAPGDAGTSAAARPADPAYVIYTSGSTGEPKGVVVSHRAIVNRLLWMKAHYALSPASRFLQKTPYTFDVSVWELFLPMLCAAPLIVAEPGLHRDPQALARLIRHERVTVAHFVPSMLSAFLSEPDSQGLALDHVFCSGEALSASLRDRFHAGMDSSLHNLYGPTEAAVDVSYWEASQDDTSDPVPIGFPVWNTQCYILDQARRPVPPGVAGTLYLGGRQLADGYLGRPDLTAERFSVNPFSSEPDARLYDTGDLARWREDGAIVYLGRLDHQIKLRGQRIELAEIQATLARHPACGELAVLARADRRGELRIIAYVVAERQERDSAALLDHARRHLPDAMVPSAIVWLDSLPVNANGKLDAKALPAPAFENASGRSVETATERAVATSFQEVLGLDDVPGADDDFFSLGGHSLLAAQLAAQLREHFHAELPLGAIFEHPTTARLAAYLDALADPQSPALGDGFGPLFTLQPDTGQGRPALFCIHPAGGLSWCYGLLARRLPSHRPIIGIQSPALTAAPTDITTLRELARRYTDQIQAVQPEGPYHLLGWSVGGIIAQEIACELLARQALVGVVCLLDAYPSEVWRRRAEPTADAAYKAILHIAGHDPGALEDVTLDRDGVVGFLRRCGHPLGKLGDRQLDGILASVEFNNSLVRQHEHRRYDGAVLYFRAALDHQGEDLHPDMWRPWIAKLVCHDLASLHAHLTGEAATSEMLPLLDASLQTADTAAARPEHTCT